MSKNKGISINDLVWFPGMPEEEGLYWFYGFPWGLGTKTYLNIPQLIVIKSVAQYDEDDEPIDYRYFEYFTGELSLDPRTAVGFCSHFIPPDFPEKVFRDHITDQIFHFPFRKEENEEE